MFIEEIWKIKLLLLELLARMVDFFIEILIEWINC